MHSTPPSPTHGASPPAPSEVVVPIHEVITEQDDVSVGPPREEGASGCLKASVRFLLGLVGGALGYAMFMNAILFQSITDKVIDPNDWERDLRPRSWVAGILIFVVRPCAGACARARALVPTGRFTAFPLPPRAPATSAGTLPRAPGRSPFLPPPAVTLMRLLLYGAVLARAQALVSVPFVAFSQELPLFHESLEFFLAFLVLLLLSQLATIWYAFLRPELCTNEFREAAFEYGAIDACGSSCGCAIIDCARSRRGRRRVRISLAKLGPAPSRVNVVSVAKDAGKVPAMSLTLDTTGERSGAAGTGAGPAAARASPPEEHPTWSPGKTPTSPAYASPGPDTHTRPIIISASTVCPAVGSVGPTAGSVGPAASSLGPADPVPDLAPWASKNGSRFASTNQVEEVVNAAPGDRTKRFVLIRVPFSLTSWRNWMYLIIIAIEAIQLIGLGIGGHVGALRVAGDLVSSSVLATGDRVEAALVSFGSEGSDDPAEVAFIASVVTCSIYIIMCGVFISLNLPVTHPMGPALFTFMAGALFVTITSALVRSIGWTRDSGRAIFCLLLLVYYSSTGVFVSIYRGDQIGQQLEIRVVPVFVAIERVLKGVLAVSAVFLKEEPAARSIVALSVISVYLLVHTFFQPISIVALNSIRSGLIMLAWWAAVISLVGANSAEAQSSRLVAGLVAGWVLILGVTILFARVGHDAIFAWCCEHRSKRQVHFPRVSVAAVPEDAGASKVAVELGPAPPTEHNRGAL